MYIYFPLEGDYRREEKEEKERREGGAKLWFRTNSRSDWWKYLEWVIEKLISGARSEECFSKEEEK